MAQQWSYAELVFTPLTQTGLMPLARALDCPSVRECLVYYSEPTVAGHLRVQAQRDRSERELCFAVTKDGMPVALAGLLAHRDGVETVTYVTESMRRRGVNTACKQMQFTVAALLQLPLYAGSKPWNTTSALALQAHWPDAEAQLTPGVSPNGRPYKARTWLLTTPPVRGVAPTIHEEVALRRLLQELDSPLTAGMTGGAHG